MAIKMPTYEHQTLTELQQKGQQLGVIIQQYGLWSNCYRCKYLYPNY